MNFNKERMCEGFNNFLSKFKTVPNDNHFLSKIIKTTMATRIIRTSLSRNDMNFNKINTEKFQKNFIEYISNNKINLEDNNKSYKFNDSTLELLSLYLIKVENYDKDTNLNEFKSDIKEKIMKFDDLKTLKNDLTNKLKNVVNIYAKNKNKGNDKDFKDNLTVDFNEAIYSIGYDVRVSPSKYKGKTDMELLKASGGWTEQGRLRSSKIRYLISIDLAINKINELKVGFNKENNQEKERYRYSDTRSLNY